MDATALAALRREFPVTERLVYLNHAAIAPLPRRSARMVAERAREMCESGDRRWPQRNRRVEEVRALAARLVGAAEPHEIAFVENTATALSLVSVGLSWRAGDNVVSAQHEFPSNVHPWKLPVGRGVEYRVVPERAGRIDPEELLSRVDERTRVLALSWVQYGSGFRSDLARLGRFCRQRGVLFVVDAIQGLGALEVDVVRDGVDVLAAAAHKWLLGPEGVAVLYVSDRVLERIRPARAGWRSVPDPFDFGPFDWERTDLTFAPGARRLECGTLNVLGIHALGESIALLLEVGIGVVEDRVLTLARRVAEGLAERGFELVADRRPGEESGIVTAVHPRRPAAEIVQRLADEGVVVAERLGRLRVSPHVYNGEEEIDRLLAELEGLSP